MEKINQLSRFKKIATVQNGNTQLSEKIFNLTEGEFKDYESLKSNKDKYNAANKILGKILLIFLADLGLRLENNKTDFIESSQNKRVVAREETSDSSIQIERDKESLEATQVQKVVVEKPSQKIKKISKEELTRRKREGITHPGAIPEIPHGTVLEDGLVAGEKEAFEHFLRFEESLFTELAKIGKDELRSRFSDKFYWFQRPGNFRVRQKCRAVQGLQSELELQLTEVEVCRKNLQKVHQEIWSESFS